MVSRAKGIPALAPVRSRDGHPGSGCVMKEGASPAPRGTQSGANAAHKPAAARGGGGAPAGRRDGREEAEGNDSHLSRGGATAAGRGRRRKGSRAEGLRRSGREGSRGLEEELSAGRRRRAGAQSGQELTAAGAAGREGGGGGQVREPPTAAGRRPPAGPGVLGSAPRQRGGGPRALWCRGGTRLRLAAFERGPRSGAGRRSPPAPALGRHEEPADPPPLALLEPGAGKSPRAHPRPRPRRREKGKTRLSGPRRGRPLRLCPPPPSLRCLCGPPRAGGSLTAFPRSRERGAPSRGCSRYGDSLRETSDSPPPALTACPRAGIAQARGRLSRRRDPRPSSPPPLPGRTGSGGPGRRRRRRGGAAAPHPRALLRGRDGSAPAGQRRPGPGPIPVPVPVPGGAALRRPAPGRSSPSPLVPAIFPGSQH